MTETLYRPRHACVRASRARRGLGTGFDVRLLNVVQRLVNHFLRYQGLAMVRCYVALQSYLLTLLPLLCLLIMCGD